MASLSDMYSSGLGTSNPASSVATPSSGLDTSLSWDDFLNQTNQYFGPLNSANSLSWGEGSKSPGYSNATIANIPGIGQLQRYYEAAPTQDQYTFSAGADAGFGATGAPDVASYQAALDKYNAIPEDQRYSFSNAATLNPNAISGHNQTYSYDPTTGGVKADGTDWDTRDSLGDKLFPALILSAIGAAGGAAVGGIAGIGAGAESAGVAGAETGAGGFDAAALNAGEDAIANGTYGATYGAGGGALDGGAGGEFAADTSTGYGGDGSPEFTGDGTGGLESPVPSSTPTPDGSTFKPFDLSSYPQNIQDAVNAYNNQNFLLKAGEGSLLTSGAESVLGNNAGSDTGVSVNSNGGGPSGNGLSFSDARGGTIDGSGGDYNGGLSGPSNTPTLGGLLSQYADNPLSALGDAYSGIKGLTGLNGGQLAGSLYSLFNGINQSKTNANTLSQLQSIYKPGGDYSNQLRDQLARRDAAQGRQSQYGPREVELESKLAGLQAGILGGSNYNALNQSVANPYSQGLNSLFGFIGQNQATTNDRGAASASTIPGNVLDNLLTKYFGSN